MSAGVAALALLQAAGLSATNYQVDAPMAAPTAAPSWRDEFDGAGVDASKWRFDTANNRTGWFNHELQYYADAKAANARIEQGALVIEARREAASDRPDWGGQRYSSARLMGRQTLGYGFYEVRALLPCARGTWPAIWMVPTSGSWPAGGEIDIMEMVGWNPNVVHATLHTALYNHRLHTQRGAEARVATACTAWHRYQLDWSTRAITIGVDDHAYFRVANDRPGGAGAWPFTRPFAMILNVAVGGDWGGQQGVDDAALPQRMRVDYVRFWQAAPAPGAATAPRP